MSRCESRTETPVIKISEMGFEDRIHLDKYCAIVFSRGLGWDQNLIGGVWPIQAQSGRKGDEEVVKADL